MTSSPHTPTITWRALRALLEALKRHDALAASRVAQAHGLSLDEPQVDHRRHGLPQYYALLESIADALDDQEYGLWITIEGSLEVFDALGYLLYTSATLGLGLERLCQYKALWSDGESFWLEDGQVDQRPCGWVGWRPWGPPRLGHLYHAQMFLSDVLRGGELLLGRPLPILSIELGFARPAVTTQLEALAASVPITYERAQTRVAIDADAMGWELSRADALLSSYFEAQVRTLLDELEVQDELVEQLERAIIERLPKQEVSLSQLAAALHMSERTLQRRLAQHELRFSEVIDRVRLRLAKRYLSQGMNVAQVAYMLGFSEPRALTRAFKRWTGRSPGAWLNATITEKGQ